MSWSLFRWVWRLEAPLFIGMSPAGALNRCRPYVPARALWGAVTAEIARLKSGESFPDYKGVGDEVKRSCRFTYLFPAEKRDGRFLAWLPKFEKEKGLRWHLQGCGESRSDRDFRRRLLDTRPGTAIMPESDSALEGSLRHTECIGPWWRDSNSQGETAAPVLLLGYVFLNDDLHHEQGEKIHEQKDIPGRLRAVETLFIGGDTRYGLGKIRRIDESSNDTAVFGKPVRPDREHPEIGSDIVLGHAPEGGGDEGMQGAKELLGGWDRGSPWKGGKLAWAPGSCDTNHTDEKPVYWSIDREGYWARRNDR